MMTVPVEVGRVEGAGEVEEGDRALVLVAVVAAGEERGRAGGAADDGDRDHDAAPGAVVAAVGQAQEAVARAGGVEVDGGGDRRGRQVVMSVDDQ